MTPISESTLLFSAFTVAVGLFTAGALYQQLHPDLRAEIADIEFGPRCRVPLGFYRWYDFLFAGMLIVFLGWAAVSASKGNEMQASAFEESMDPRSLEIVRPTVSIVGSALLAGVVMAVVLPRVRLRKWLGLHWVGWRWILLMIPAALACDYLFTVLLIESGYIEWMQSLGFDSPPDQPHFTTGSSAMGVALTLISATIAAPIGEEIVFRGYLYGFAKRYSGKWPAVISSSLAFSAMHGDVVAVIPIFIGATIMTLLYEKSGSLWVPVITHALWNGLITLSQLYQCLSPEAG